MAGPSSHNHDNHQSTALVLWETLVSLASIRTMEGKDCRQSSVMHGRFDLGGLGRRGMGEESDWIKRFPLALLLLLGGSFSALVRTVSPTSEQICVLYTEMNQSVRPSLDRPYGITFTVRTLCVRL